MGEQGRDMNEEGSSCCEGILAPRAKAENLGIGTSPTLKILSSASPNKNCTHVLLLAMSIVGLPCGSAFSAILASCLMRREPLGGLCSSAGRVV